MLDSRESGGEPVLRAASRPPRPHARRDRRAQPDRRRAGQSHAVDRVLRVLAARGVARRRRGSSYTTNHERIRALGLERGDRGRPSPPRPDGRPSPRLVLRCEEGRGSFEQVALLLSPRSRRSSSRSSEVTTSSCSWRSAWSWRCQFLSVCSDTPSLCECSLGVRPARSICTAPRRKLRRVRRSRLGHGGHHPVAPNERNSSGVRKPGELQG
jgi:hypothetical protein